MAEQTEVKEKKPVRATKTRAPKTPKGSKAKQEQAIEAVETAVPEAEEKKATKAVKAKAPRAKKTVKTAEAKSEPVPETVTESATAVVSMETAAPVVPVENKASEKSVTRAEKIKRLKEVVRELLLTRDYKWNELLETATKLYAERHADEQNELNDLKGRIGSAFDLLEKEGAVKFDKPSGMCSWVGERPAEKSAEPKKRGKKKAETAQAEPKKEPEKAANEEAPAPKKRGRKKIEPVKEEKAEEKTVESAPTPVQAEEKPAAEVKDEKPAETPAKEAEKTEKKQTPVFDMTLLLGGKTEKKTDKKTESKAEGTPMPKAAAKSEEPLIAQSNEAKEEKHEEPKKTALPEFAFLGNAGVKARETAKSEAKAEEKPAQKAEAKEEAKERKSETRAEQKPLAEKSSRTARGSRGGRSGAQKTVVVKTEEEELKEAFLKRLRALGGEYFEYYSVYLLERYSLKNGRRLEGLRISGGDKDGGIDGELVLTDKFGFRETIYIQCKNWDPTKGDKEKWVVGETLLQQFIGAVACKQAKEGKRKARGIFVTTSIFTDGARDILDSMSADFIGYDGGDVFETAKECGFGIIEKDGKWVLDEKLLSGGKAFFELV